MVTWWRICKVLRLLKKTQIARGLMGSLVTIFQIILMSICLKQVLVILLVVWLHLKDLFTLVSLPFSVLVQHQNTLQGH
jgi:hypothetical protein